MKMMTMNSERRKRKKETAMDMSVTCDFAGSANPSMIGMRIVLFNQLCQNRISEAIYW
jgi:hypothetical protein